MAPSKTGWDRLAPPDPAAASDAGGARPAPRAVPRRLAPHHAAGGELNTIAGTVFEIGYRGDMSIYKVRLADRSLMKVALANTSANGQAPFGIDDLVWLSWPPEAGVVLTR